MCVHGPTVSRAAGLLQHLEVTELAGQEDVIPAADRADRHGDRGHPAGVIEPGPARAVRGTGQHVLDVGRVAADGGHVGLAQRQRAQRPADAARLGERAQHRATALLARHQDAPAERGLQGQAVRAQELQGERGLGEVRDHRLDLGRQPVGHRPLHVAQVARPDQHDRPAEPRLFHHPVQGGQAVVAFLPHRVERAAGAERAPDALHQHLVAAFGQRAGQAGADQPAPTVRAAQQRHRQPPPPHLGRPPVGQQDGPVRHRHLEVALHGQVAGLRRAQPRHALDEIAAQVHRRCSFTRAGCWDSTANL